MTTGATVLHWLPMKLFIAFVVLLPVMFTGCATKVFEGGLPVLVVYSNTSHLEFHTPEGTSLVMDNVDNSTPTRVGLDGITKAGVAIGMAIATHGASSMLH